MPTWNLRSLWPLILTISANAMAADAVYTPLLDCRSDDTKRFSFKMIGVSGCEIQPGGQICVDRIILQVQGWNPETQTWQDTGYITHPTTTAVIDKDHESFSWHYAKANSSEHIDIDVQGQKSTIDINANCEFYLVPSVDTNGAQKSAYRCRLL